MRFFNKSAKLLIMKIFASVIYRVLVPKYFRTKILEFYLPKQILKYYQNNPEKNTKEIAHAVDYLRRKPLAVFPYDFQDEYIAGAIEVFRNPDNKLPYVIHHGKRLYFKRRWGSKKSGICITYCRKSKMFAVHTVI